MRLCMTTTAPVSTGVPAVGGVVGGAVVGALIWAAGTGVVEGGRESGAPGAGSREEGRAPDSSPSSPERSCSVFYGAPSKSKFLSTLCSGDVCQCAEGEAPGRLVRSRLTGWGGPCPRSSWPHLREVPATAPCPGAGAAGRGRLQDEVCLLPSPSGVWYVLVPPPAALRTGPRVPLP